MDEGDALVLLRKNLGGESNEDDAVELVQVLDYMPLAITQAAAFIKQRAPRTTVSRYLRDFRKSDKSKANLLNRDIGDLRRYGSASNSVITTWHMSFEHIRRVRPSAARLLQLMSFFDPRGIPEVLLLYEGDNNIDMDREGDTNFKFEDDIFTWTSYSLITAGQAGGLFEMHPLVQFTAKKWVEAHGALGERTEMYVTIMYRAFPTGEYENWEKCRVLYPHAQAVLACRPANKECLLQWAALLMDAGWYSRAKGNYLGAEEMSRRALERYEKVLGEDHPNTLTSVYCLAHLLRKQQQYKDASALYQRAYNGYKRTLAVDHPTTLACSQHHCSMLEAMDGLPAGYSGSGHG